MGECTGRAAGCRLQGPGKGRLWLKVCHPIQVTPGRTLFSVHDVTGRQLGAEISAYVEVKLEK